MSVKKAAAAKGNDRQVSMSRMLVVAVLLVHLVVLILALIVNFFQLYRISRQQTLQNAYAKLDYLEYQIANLHANLTDIQRLLIQDRRFQEYIATRRKDDLYDIELRSHVNGKLDQIIASYAYIESITLFQTAGAVLNVSPTRTALEKNPTTVLPVQKTPAFARVSDFGPLRWGGVYEHWEMIPAGSALPDKMPVVAILIPLLDYWNPVQASVLSVNIPWSYFDFLVAPEVNDGSGSYLFDAEGNCLYSTGGQKPEIAGQYGKAAAQGNADKGSFTVKDGGSRWEIIYNQYNEIGWYLVQEVPYSSILGDMMQLQVTTGATFLCAILIAVAISYGIIWRMLRSLKSIIGMMSDIGNGQLEKRLPGMRYQELSQLSAQFNDMMMRIRILHEQNLAHEEERRLLEIEALQAQINPHFLHNSLTTIRWMASMARASNVCQAILALNNVLQPIFSQKSITWTVKMEQSFLQNYIDIMSYRFGETISCVYRIPEELGQLEILRFILQPPVENAIIHGLRGRDDGIIEIVAHIYGQDLIIDIADNGAGIPGDRLAVLRASLLKSAPLSIKAAGHGIGLYNVNRRIRLQYGEAYGMSIQCPAAGGTVVSIKIPRCTGSKELPQI